MNSTAPEAAAQHPSDPGDEAGRVVGERYALRRCIGRGAMGVVYEAENLWTHRRVALKLLEAGHAAGSERVVRFIREARAAAALRHPNVVDVLDMGEDPADGALYIVQELLEGEDLSALLAREGPLDEARALRLLTPVLRGLAAAHAAGIVHRDVKPANLFLARDAEGALVPKVIDFGIAKDRREVARTATGVTVGTPAYMAPEQLRAAREIGPAADVWALGVVLHEMLTGAHPYDTDNFHILVHRVLSGEAPPPHPALAGVSATTRAVLSRCFAASPDARFASAAEMLAALSAPTHPVGLADTHPALAAAPTQPPAPTAPTTDAVRAPSPPATQPSRRWAYALLGAALLASVLALGLGNRGAPPVVSPSPPSAPQPVAPPPAPTPTAGPAPAEAPLAEAPAVAPAPSTAPSAPPTVAARRPHATRRDPRPVAPPTAPSEQAAPPAPVRPRARLLAPGGAYPSE